MCIRDRIDQLSVVEREVYYVDNTTPGCDVVVDARGRIEACEQQALGDAVVTGLLRLALSVHDAAGGKLLALANVTKRLIVPRSRAGLVHDAERFCRQHG